MSVEFGESRSGSQSSFSKTRSYVVSGAVTFGAIAVFVALAGMVVPKAFQSLAGLGAGADNGLAAALLLNVALILFGWRQCRNLKREVEARHDAEEVAQTLAFQDYTTGLHNRRSLSRTVAERCAASAGPAALLVIDLDHFKKVNDLYGHAAGDGLLRDVADLIRRSVSDDACCARLGGDEFAVALFGEAALPANVDRAVESILRNLSTPFVRDGNSAHVGASIGISMMERGDCLETSLQRSDIAMYEAKKRGRNCFAWFDASMEDEVRRRNRIEADIRAGIPAGQFIPYFQPQIDLESGELKGFEALARWEHPELGLVEPDDFMAVAESTGLIRDLSLSIMRQAMFDAAKWGPHLTLAVNVSPVQLKDPLLAQRITKLLLETGFPPQRLELEVSESSLLDNLELAVATIESLKNLGILISLDDFGTGYASLTQLQALPFDRIKIDRSFVTAMAGNAESAAIVGAIASLGASLRLPIMAEGIENQTDQNSLRLLGCSGGQGWHIGRPMPAVELREMLTKAADASQNIVRIGTDSGEKVVQDEEFGSSRQSAGHGG
jgi:diguanylate cyclase (GGDEF)-like protein